MLHCSGLHVIIGEKELRYANVDHFSVEAASNGGIFHFDFGWRELVDRCFLTYVTFLLFILKIGRRG